MPSSHEFTPNEESLFEELFQDNSSRKKHFESVYDSIAGHTVLHLQKNINHKVVLEALHGLEDYLQGKDYSITSKKRVFMVVYESVQNLELEWMAIELKIIDCPDSFIVYSVLSEKVATDSQWMHDLKQASKIITNINSLTRKELRDIRINILKNHDTQSHLVYSSWLNVGLRVTPPLLYHFEIIESEECVLQIIAKIAK